MLSLLGIDTGLCKINEPNTNTIVTAERTPTSDQTQRRLLATDRTRFSQTPTQQTIPPWQFKVTFEWSKLHMPKVTLFQI